MTTTTTFQGLEPGSKSSSRVLRPPGGASNISFGTDEEKTPSRKNRTASNIFAGPDDPHANRRNNPPGGSPSGVLCGEPSAPLRRCHQEPIWKCLQAEEALPTPERGVRQDGEGEQEEESGGAEEPAGVKQQQEEDDNKSAANPVGRRNPPGGKSSLILG